MKIALVTAVDKDYIKKLRWSLPTWHLKKQFRQCDLHIFYNQLEASDLEWVKEYWPDVKLIPWDMPEVEQREKMLSCFVLGVANCLSLDYTHYIKLDADCYCKDRQNWVFDKEDFEADICGHKWGYTKPAWWVAYMKAWVRDEVWNGKKDRKGTVGSKRIISWCCLHKMSFVRSCAMAAGDRLPIPSHDSYLCFMADEFPDATMKRKNLKDKGMDHGSRFRGLRENICARAAVNNNKYLNEKLLQNIQLEITTACNLKCANCDRNCGTAPSSEHMSLIQVKKFAYEWMQREQSDVDPWCGFSRVDIIGGEPLLHKELEGIIIQLRDAAKKTRLTTNGILKDRLSDIPNWVEVRNSSKDKDKCNKFDAVNMAPIDEGITDALSCSIPWRCGIALTRYGYFPCGAGASIARVFGLDIGIKSLSDVTPDALRGQMKELCKYCGHSLSNKTDATVQRTSKSWTEAFKTYKDKELTLY
jgi:hypothetical protein